MASQADREEQIRRLAHALCDEADASCIEIGVMAAADLVPFDQLPDSGKAVYEKMAERIYKRLIWNAVGGVIVVLPKEGDRLR